MIRVLEAVYWDGGIYVARRLSGPPDVTPNMDMFMRYFCVGAVSNITLLESRHARGVADSQNFLSSWHEELELKISTQHPMTFEDIRSRNSTRCISIRYYYSSKEKCSRL